MRSLETRELFSSSDPLFAALVSGARYPWEALKWLSRRIAALCRSAGGEFIEIRDGVLVHRTARVAPTASLQGPCIIGAGSELRQGAFVRGGVYVGEHCVVGNSTELKNCILCGGAQTPHFNYVGDAILGAGAHLGAGSIVSNLKADGSPVEIVCKEGRICTGLRKCGAFLGDGAEVGCNAVLNPGTVVGKGTRIYPLTCARGYYPPHSLVRQNGTVERLRP